MSAASTSLLGALAGGAVVLVVSWWRATTAKRALLESTALADALRAERDRLRASLEALVAAIPEELRDLDDAIAVSHSGNGTHAAARAQRGELARAQLALVSRGSEALDQFATGVLYR